MADRLAIALFLPATILLTWPLVVTFASRLPHYVRVQDFDVFNNAWALWWVKKALWDLHQTPWETTYLFYPAGTPLTLASLSPLSGLLALPFTVKFGLPGVGAVVGRGGLTGVIAGYNAMVLLSFFVGAVGAYRVARRCGAGPTGAWLAGAVFAFSPYHYVHIRQIELVAIEWLPYVFLGLDAVLETGSLAGKLGLALAFSANAYASTTYLASVVLLGTFHVLERLAGRFDAARSRKEALADLALPATMAVVLCLPLIFRIGIDPFAWRFETASALENLAFAPSLDDFIRAGSAHYLGVMVLVLALHGALRVPAARRWFALALAGALLSLGPVLKIHTQPTGLHLPYELLWSLPGLGQSRFSDRFLVYFTLGAAICVGLSLTWIERNLLAGRHAWVWVGVRGAIIVLSLLDGLHLPLWTIAPDVPSVYRRIARQPAGVPVFEVPADYLTNRYFMLDQIVHEHPIVQGHLARRTLTSYDAELRAGRRAWPGAILVVHADLLRDGHRPPGQPLADLARGHELCAWVSDGEVRAYKLKPRKGPVR